MKSERKFKFIKYISLLNARMLEWIRYDSRKLRREIKAACIDQFSACEAALPPTQIWEVLIITDKIPKYGMGLETGGTSTPLTEFAPPLELQNF